MYHVRREACILSFRSVVCETYSVDATEGVVNLVVRRGCHPGLQIIQSFDQLLVRVIELCPLIQLIENTLTSQHNLEAKQVCDDIRITKTSSFKPERKNRAIEDWFFNSVLLPDCPSRPTVCWAVSCAVVAARCLPAPPPHSDPAGRSPDRAALS